MNELDLRSEYFHVIFAVFVQGKLGRLQYFTSKQILQSTPVLGKGYVPSKEEIQTWIEEGKAIISKHYSENESSMWDEEPKIEDVYKECSVDGYLDQPSALDAIIRKLQTIDKKGNWEMIYPTHYLMLPKEVWSE